MQYFDILTTHPCKEGTWLICLLYASIALSPYVHRHEYQVVMYHIYNMD